MPVTDSVELDIAGALAAVDSIGGALDAVIGNFTGSISDALASIDVGSLAEVVIPVGADTTQADADFLDFAAFIDSTVTTIQSELDISTAEGDLSTLVDEISAATPDPIIAEVSVDVAGAEGLQALGAEAQASGADVAEMGQKSEEASAQTAGLGGAAQVASGEIGNLAVAGQLAGGELETVGGITAIMSEGLGSGVEKAGELAEKFGAELGPEAEAVAGSLTAVAGGVAVFGTVVDQLVQKGTALTAAQQRLDLTTKGQASSFQDLSAAGLGEIKTQTDLGTAYGASAAQIDAINAKQAAIIGSSDQLTASQKAQLPGLLALVSANAVAVGTQGDYASALDSSLKKLGNYNRAQTDFGASVDKSNVEQAQAKLGIEGTFASLDKATKAFIVGTAIQDKYGDSLKENVVKGTEQADIGFKELGAGFQNFIGEISKPLVSPALDLLRSAEPIGRDVAQLFASLAQSVLPMITRIIGAVEPLVTIITDELSSALEDIGPEIEQVGQILGDALADPEVRSAIRDLAKSGGELARDLAPVLPLLAELGTLLLPEVIAPVQQLTDTINDLLEPVRQAKTLLQQLGIVDADAAVATKKHTEARRDERQAVDDLITGTQELSDKTLAHVAAMNEQAAAARIGGDGFAFLALGINNLRGTSDENLKVISDSLGLDAKAFKGWRDDVIKQVDAVVASATAGLPKISDAFSLNGKQLVDPSTIENQLKGQAKTVDDFTKNIETLHARGLDNLVNQLIQEGPIIGGALAAALVNSAPARAQALENQLVETNRSYQRLIDFVHNDFAPAFIAVNGEAGRTAASQFNLELSQIVPFAETTAGRAAKAFRDAIHDATPAQLTGLGSFLASAVFQGFNESVDVLAGDAAAKTAKAFAGIGGAVQAILDIHSPSGVFAEIGRNVMEGFNEGIAATDTTVVDQVSQVIAEAERIAREASTAINAAPPLVVPQLGALGTPPVSNAGATFDIKIDLTVAPGVTPEHGAEVGEAAAKSFIATLASEAHIS